jgi:pimeloyl-ACP methyl ester carboxylesterase
MCALGSRDLGRSTDLQRLLANQGVHQLAQVKRIAGGLGRARVSSQPHPLQQARPSGHFAAWEQPDLFAAEMRASFKSLR